MEVQLRCREPIPPGLSSGFSCEPVRVGDVYLTTSQHAFKPRSKTTPNLPVQRRAPGSWKVHYTMHTINKCGEKAWSPALTMGRQCSEMKGAYQGRMDTIAPTLPERLQKQPLQHKLQDHLNNNRTKDLPPSSSNRTVEGRPVVPSQGGVRDRLEPYLTTNQCCHRYFPPAECRGYPHQDSATYWICENYPKSWGYGPVVNPLAGEDVQKFEQKGRMRDRLVFKTATTLPPIHTHTNKPTASSGESEYSETYTCPPHDNTFSGTVPPFMTSNKDTSLVQTVPNMYKSINTSYGGTAGLHKTTMIEN